MSLQRLFKVFLVVILMYSLSFTLLSVSFEAKEQSSKEEEVIIKTKKVDSVKAMSTIESSKLVEEQSVNPVIGNLEDYQSIQEMNTVFYNENDSFYKEYLSIEYLEHGQAEVCPEIRNYKSVVKRELSKYDLSSHSEFFMALLQKESGCFESIVNGDIAQASESLGLEPNTIQDPSYSIQIGIEYYSNLINTYMGEDVDVRFIIHSYNFGERLIREAIEDNSNYTIAYIIEKAKIYKKDYFGDIARKDNEWRPFGAEYGDLRYVANLFSIYTK